ncbi:MAG: PASTA domain-containing protein [Reichenbachiella sp.]
MTKLDVLKHLVLAITLVVLIVLGIFYIFFPVITNHGESMTVPNLEGILLEDLDEFLEERDLRYQIEPDSGYSAEHLPLAVLKQFPLSGSKVKENRKIYLTLNAKNPPVVKIPSLKGRSLKNAQLELRSLGLALGDITYKPDFALNTVLGQFFQSRRIEEGEQIPKGSKIDFEVGDGLGNQTFQMLDLKELGLEEAEFVLRGYGLQLGEVFYKEEGSFMIEEEDEEGETISVPKEVSPGGIFKQIPRANNNTKIGQSVDLWIVQIDSTDQALDIPTLGVVSED